jgi:N-acetylmuramoyl-L-alanine amidase-like protein
VRLAGGVLALVLAAGCRPGASEPLAPASVRLLSRAAWGANAPVLAMKTHTPQRITIHHTGTRQAPARSLAEKMQALQRFSQREDSLADGRRKRQWADVPYHMYIAVDGEVAEGREWRYVGDSNTPYDPTGHFLIVLEGSFDSDTLMRGQREALDALVVAAAKRWRIPPERIAGHRDFAQTRCPGRNVYAELARLRRRVAGSG